jgi:streptogramin lyase
LQLLPTSDAVAGNYLRLILRLAALALACTLASPALAAPPRTLRFEQLGVEDGLAQESVLSIVQDRQGFMWFGSQAGLSRFDGYKVTVYRNIVGDRRSMSENWVGVLHLDPHGRMWVGTDGGLDLFDPRSQSFSHFLPQEPEKRGSGNRHVKSAPAPAASATTRSTHWRATSRAGCGSPPPPGSTCWNRARPTLSISR